MRGNGSQPTDHRHTGQPTGVFSTVGAEPRSSWTTPGATVIPNPSVDPRLRSWVDPDVVPGVLGPPRPNPTSHGDVAMPGAVEASAGQGSEQGALGVLHPLVPATVSGHVAAGRTHRRGQTGLMDLSRDPRARLVGALVLVVLLVLLVGRIGDMTSSAGDLGTAATGWVAAVRV
jgi:hypothetical protein